MEATSGQNDPNIHHRQNQTHVLCYSYDYIAPNGKRIVKYTTNAQVATNKSNDVDFMESISKYEMGVIASTACGLKSQAFEGKESVFEKYGKKLQFKVSFRDFIEFLLMMMFPKVTNFLGISVFEKEADKFFTGAVVFAIKQRKQSGTKLCMWLKFKPRN